MPTTLPCHRMSPAADDWWNAVSTHAHLFNGGRLTAVPPPDPDLLWPGETAVAVIEAHLGYARESQVIYPIPAPQPALVVGTVPFVIGYEAASWLGRVIRRRTARQLPPGSRYWQHTPLRTVVVTDQRLLCEIVPGRGAGTTWRRFPYSLITHLGLQGGELVLELAGMEKLQLTGDLAPWCAAVVAHYRYGQAAPHFVPQLHAAAARPAAV